jgi:hypothetical protein
MAKNVPTASKTSLYSVQYNDCCNFVAGVVPEGEQVLMGVVGQGPLHVVAAFFDKSGCFLRVENRRVTFVEKSGQTHAQQEAERIKALWSVLDAWKAEIGLVPNEVKIGRFHLPECDNWGEGIGLFDLPKFMQDCVDDPSSEKDEQFRQELLDDIGQFQSEGKYVLRWGTEYWMSKRERSPTLDHHPSRRYHRGALRRKDIHSILRGLTWRFPTEK